MKRQHKLWGVIALSGALAIAISGCSATGGSTGGSTDKPAETKTADYNPQPRENLKQGGEAHFWISEVPAQMNFMNGDGTADTSRLAAWYTPQVFSWTRTALSRPTRRTSTSGTPRSRTARRSSR
jgi:peptide/nickel transport system substrate-binding protein